MQELAIEVVADVVCPWCYIGMSRLDTAMASFAERARFDVEMKPFLLEPKLPDEGADLREWLGKKYGDPEPLFRRVETVARDSGIVIDFAKVRRNVPTVRAHTMLRHARARGTQRALARDLYAAYFTDGRDVSAMDVLVELGERHGFSREDTIGLLETPEELAETRRLASPPGISGVPYTIVDRKVAVSGAQSVAVFQSAIERALVGA